MRRLGLSANKVLKPMLITSKSRPSKNATRLSAHFPTSQPPTVVRTCVTLGLSLQNVLRTTMACTFSTSEPPKCSVFSILSSKLPWRQTASTFPSFPTLQPPKAVPPFLVHLSVLRHNSTHLFNISISTSVPRLVCFLYVDFASQWRAIF